MSDLEWAIGELKKAAAAKLYGKVTFTLQNGQIQLVDLQTQHKPPVDSKANHT